MYYYDADGHMYQNAGAQIDGYWYYFDANGVMKRNSWREKDGLQYYYDADGHLSMNIGLLLPIIKIFFPQQRRRYSMADQIDGNQICILLFCTKKGIKTCDLTGSSCKQHLFPLFQPCFCSLIASSDIRLYIFGRLDLPQIFLRFNLSMFCFPFIRPEDQSCGIPFIRESMKMGI